MAVVKSPFGLVNRDSPPSAPPMPNHFVHTVLPPSGFPPLTFKDRRPKPTEPEMSVGLQKNLGNPPESSELKAGTAAETEFFSERPLTAPQAGGV